ncbi:hypothetical protein ABVK25_012473 [Lepraria finkii]|uniref:Uncharacterized protein n=1 Tax=Lepraria finkii TaxID=1340010 RepID=A0ABR4AE33_9LECA
MGIKKDIHLKGDNYDWLSSMFYFGYLAWEYPTNRLLQRLPLAKYSSFCIMMWGLVLSCMAATSNFQGALAVRFFLGVFEAAVTPGFALFTSQWYTKSEQGTRIGIWFSFQRLGPNPGVASSPTPSPRASTTTGAAHPSLENRLPCHGPPSPSPPGVLFPDFHARQPAQRALPHGLRPPSSPSPASAVNQQGIGNKHFKMYQLKEALMDPMAWAFTFYALTADIPNGGISNFFYAATADIPNGGISNFFSSSSSPSATPRANPAVRHPPAAPSKSSR